jgi:hypothetical protein
VAREERNVTNLEILKKSRRPPKVGDVFTFRIGDRWRFGRVIRTDAHPLRDYDANLFYIYRTARPEPSPTPDLRRDDLLLPPMMTNRLPWSRGYFEVLENRQLTSDDVFPQHCFTRQHRVYVDEYRNPLAARHEPCGDFVLHSYRTIDDAISEALGIPLVPD